MPARARPACLLFLAVVVTAMAVGPSVGWNENSRHALTMAIVDRGTFAIDAYHDDHAWGTEDKALAGGHYYSDKIIGASLLGIPGYAAARALLGPLRPRAARFSMCLFAVYVPAGISAVLFWRLLVRLGTAARLALAITAGVFFGTMWFAYSTSMYPYAAGIAAVLAALRLVLSERTSHWTAAATGLLLGVALLMDYTFGLAAALVGIALVARQPPSRAAIAAGVGVVPVALFALYCRHVFGSYSIPYQHLALPAFQEGMSRGFFGATTPRAGALYFLTVHPFRGLFFWQPIVALGAVGCALSLAAPGARGIAARIGLAALVGYLLFASSYYMWWGGWAIGPRVLLPAVPLAALGAGMLGPRWTPLVLSVAALSIALMIPLSVNGPNADPGVPDELLARANVGDAVPARNLATWAAFASGSPRAPYPGIALVGGLAAALLAAAYRLVPPPPASSAQERRAPGRP